MCISIKITFHLTNLLSELLNQHKIDEARRIKKKTVNESAFCIMIPDRLGCRSKTLQT